MEKLTLSTRVKMNDGHKIPLLGFGVFQADDGDICRKAVETALETGYKHIDTATVYGNESSVGEAIKSFGENRNNLFITTKYFPSEKGSPREELAKSLEKLKLDYIDLYLIHWPVENYMESWETMRAMKEEGLCRSIGVSNYTIKRFENDFFAQYKEPPAVNQMELHAFYQRNELVNYCRNKGILMEAYSPLARAERMDNVPLNKLAASLSKSPAQVMIRYLLQKGIVALPKSVTPARIKANSQVFDFSLNQDQMAILDALDENFAALSWRPEGFY